MEVAESMLCRIVKSLPVYQFPSTLNKILSAEFQEWLQPGPILSKCSSTLGSVSLLFAGWSGCSPNEHLPRSHRCGFPGMLPFLLFPQPIQVLRNQCLEAV